MLQYDTDETYWEDSRRMATFIYNRVPPARKIPGEPWTTPLKKQYPERRSMDMTKIKPFGIIYYVYQKKPIRNKGFHGKSDKKENAKKGVLVGYEDQLGPVRVKVYHQQDKSYQWVDEDLVTFADPLMSLNKSNRGKVAVQPKEMNKEYFDPLVGTRHTDPDNGLVYETTEVKIDRQGYIVAYRRLVVRGKLTGKPDGPYHVADIESYTELDLDRLSETMRDGIGKASVPDIEEERGRTRIDELSGAASTGQDTSEGAAESTKTRKRKRRQSTHEQLTDRPRRQTNPIDRLSAGSKDSSHRQAHMTTALAAAVSSGDMFTNLAVDQIQKEATTKPRAEHMQREDFEPPTREYMQQCAYKDKWEAGEQEELRSIEKHAVWRKQAPPPGTKILPLK